jgi:hypothetical protein
MIFAPFAYRQGRVAAVVNPTLTVDFTDNAGGANVDVYKNGSFYATVTAGVQLNVPIVSGNTFYLIITSTSGGFIVADYLINSVSQGTQTATNGASLQTTTRTASGTNAYSYIVISDIF